MRLARFTAQGQARHGYVQGDVIVEADGTWEEELARASMAGKRTVPGGGTRHWPLAVCELLPPLGERSRGLICVGMNYKAHADEVGSELGTLTRSAPPIFFKLPSAVVGPRAAIAAPAISAELDWEVELGVVIGRKADKIGIEDAAGCVAGYTIVVDITARDLQKEHGQWFLGKNLAAVSPVGPWIVTADEITFPPQLDVQLSVNGAIKQAANTADLIWSAAEIISLTSQVFPLLPGDIVATGSPDGVGFTRQPPEFLQRGDTVVATIEAIGELCNVVA